MIFGVYSTSELQNESKLFLSTELVCMLVRTMHEVREGMGPLVVEVMCSIPSEDPFTLIVHTSDGTAVGEQINHFALS